MQRKTILINEGNFKTLTFEDYIDACQDRKRKSVGLDPSAFNPLATTHQQIMNQTKRSSLRDFLKLRTETIGE